ncbi:hypothetical protein LEN26_008057 [Aphanomyces euteiches]|nr:hypothetical protein AeMF1_004666 [Aphanomyces euteiches]KAH9130936.1 hypothetical protein LEN26_008057 [Aphanomyces euteiches]KAH9186073.1 hypothetical protein AeNC1_011952 [Aphanomyces euteiches]
MSDEQTYSDDEFQEDGRNSPLKPQVSKAALDEEDYAQDVALSPQDDGDYDDDTLAASASTPGLLQAPDDKLDTLYDVNDFADGDESYNDNDFTQSVDLTAPAKDPAPDLQAVNEDDPVVETKNSELSLPPTIQTPPIAQSEEPTKSQSEQLPSPDADPSIETPREKEKLQEVPVTPVNSPDADPSMETPSEEEKLEEALVTPVKPDDEATTNQSFSPDHAEVESTRIETTASDPEQISSDSEIPPVDIQQNQDNPPEVQDTTIVEAEYDHLVAQSSDSTPETTLAVEPNSCALNLKKTDFEDQQPPTDMESPSELDRESSNNDEGEIAQDEALPSREPEVAVETQDAISLESNNPRLPDISCEGQEIASDQQLEVIQSVDSAVFGIETVQLDLEVQPESPSQETRPQSEEYENPSPSGFKHLDTTSESNEIREENPLSSICDGDTPSELLVPNQATIESQEDEILACPSVFEDDTIMAGIGPTTCFNFAQSSRTMSSAFEPAMSPSHSDGISTPSTSKNKSATVKPPSRAGPPRKSVSYTSDEAAVAPKESKLKQRLPPKIQSPSTPKPPPDDPKDVMDSPVETPRQPLPSDIPMVFHSPQKDYRPWRPDKPTPRRPSPSKSKQTVTSPPKFHFEPKIDKMKEEWLLLNMFRQGDASKYQSFCSFQKASSTTTTAAMSARPSSADRSSGGGGLGPYHRHGRRRLVSPKRKHEMQAQLERERNWVDGSSQSTTIPPYDSILDKYCHTITHPVVQKQIYHAVDLSPQLAYVLEKRVQAQRQAELAFLVQESPPPPASSNAKKTNAARPPVKPTPPRKLDKMTDNTIVSIKWSTPSKR